MNTSDRAIIARKHLTERSYKAVINTKVETVIIRNKANVARYTRKVSNKPGTKLWFWLYPNATHSQKFYGLPEMYKIGVLLEPIISGIGAPSHQPTKYMRRKPSDEFLLPHVYTCRIPSREHAQV